MNEIESIEQPSRLVLCGVCRAGHPGADMQPGAGVSTLARFCQLNKWVFLAIALGFTFMAYYRDPGYIGNALFNVAMSMIFHLMHRIYSWSRNE